MNELLLSGTQRQRKSSTGLVCRIRSMKRGPVKEWNCQHQRRGKHRLLSKATRQAPGRIW